MIGMTLSAHEGFLGLPPEQENLTELQSSSVIATDEKTSFLNEKFNIRPLLLPTVDNDKKKYMGFLLVGIGFYFICKKFCKKSRTKKKKRR